MNGGDAKSLEATSYANNNCGMFKCSLINMLFDEDIGHM